MAKGHDKHKQRLDDVAFLGKTLVRRSRARCELCEESGLPLAPVEVLPLPEEPDPDHAVLICARCADGVRGRKVDPTEWRFLEGVVWSEVAPVQVVAVRMLTTFVDDPNAQWARNLLDGLYLDPDVEAWVAEHTIR